MGITINNKEFASSLLALLFICAESGTDSCDIKVTTNKGTINCHIEFSVVEDHENI